MFKVRLRVKKYRKDIFDPGVVLAEMDNAALRYARAVEEMYLDVVADWSTEHGQHTVMPMRKAAPPNTRINVYFRGPFAYIFALQDMGYTRKIAIVGGVGGKPKVGKFGTLATGRLLRNPVPMPAKRYTERIANSIRTGDTEFGTYRRLMQERLNKFVRGARGGAERVYE